MPFSSCRASLQEPVCQASKTHPEPDEDAEVLNHVQAAVLWGEGHPVQHLGVCLYEYVCQSVSMLVSLFCLSGRRRRRKYKHRHRHRHRHRHTCCPSVTGQKQALGFGARVTGSMMTAPASSFSGGQVDRATFSFASHVSTRPWYSFGMNETNTHARAHTPHAHMHAHEHARACRRTHLTSSQQMTRVEYALIISVTSYSFCRKAP